MVMWFVMSKTFFTFLSYFSVQEWIKYFSYVNFLSVLPLNDNNNSELLQSKTNSPPFISLLDTKMLNRHFKVFKFSSLMKWIGLHVFRTTRTISFYIELLYDMKCLTNDQGFLLLYFFSVLLLLYICFFAFWLMIWNGLCVSMLGRYFIQKCLPQICVNVWCSLDYCKVFSGLSVEACDVS